MDSIQLYTRVPQGCFLVARYPTVSTKPCFSSISIQDLNSIIKRTKFFISIHILTTAMVKLLAIFINSKNILRSS
jgi:hypothetical protein